MNLHTMKWQWSGGFFLLLSFPVVAELTRFSAEEVKQIVVKGPNWVLHFQHSKGPYQFELKGPGALKASEGTIEAISENYQNTKEKKAESSSLKVTGPSTPLSLFVSQAQVNLSQWEKKMFIFARQAQIQGQKNKGSWQISLKKGQIKLNQFEGELKAKGFHLDMDLKQLSGQSDLQFNEGRLKVQDGQGHLIYKTDKGDTMIKNWKGDVTGHSVSGSLNGRLKKPGTVRISSEKGPVFVNILSGRPLIKAFSESGRVRCPRYFNKKYAGKSLTVEGRLKGSGDNEGNVLLNTGSGNIFIQ